MQSSRPNSGLAFLSALYVTVILLSWMLDGIQLIIVDFAPLVLKIGGDVYPLMIGTVSIKIVLLVASLTILHLVNEFFSLRVVLFLTVVTLVCMGIVMGTIILVPNLPFILHAERLVAIHQTVFDFQPYNLLQLGLIISVGFWIISILFYILRKLTRGSFDLMRLFLSQLLGLALLSVGLTYLKYYPLLQINAPMLVHFFTIYIQWFLLSLLYIPIFYIIKLPVLVLVGSDHYENINHAFGKRKRYTFRPETDDSNVDIVHQKDHEPKIIDVDSTIS